MNRSTQPNALCAALAAVALLAAPALTAQAEGGEMPFSVSELYFELNDTDGDLGFHGLIDGEPWKKLEIEGPDERLLALIRLRSQLRRQGLTELFFESAEPNFDDLPPEVFFARFPEGTYEIEGITLEGKELESETEITHLLPAPVDNFTVNGEAVPEDCDEGPVPEVTAPFTIDWDPVTLSHPELGRTDEPIKVVRYEVIVEREEPTLVKYTILLPPDVTEVEIPGASITPGDEVKVEVLTREESGNQSATESCFEVGE